MTDDDADDDGDDDGSSQALGSWGGLEHLPSWAAPQVLINGRFVYDDDCMMNMNSEHDVFFRKDLHENDSLRGIEHEYVHVIPSKKH